MLPDLLMTPEPGIEAQIRAAKRRDLRCGQWHVVCPGNESPLPLELRQKCRIYLANRLAHRRGLGVAQGAAAPERLA